MLDVVALSRAVWMLLATSNDLLGAGVLGDGLGALRHGVLGQLTRKQETDSCLDFSGGDG